MDDQKFDSGKPLMSLVPYSTLVGVARVREYGNKKYKPDSWKDVPDGKRRYTDAMLRHLFDYLDGKEIDEESGLPHFHHFMTNVLFVEWFRQNDKE